MIECYGENKTLQNQFKSYRFGAIQYKPFTNFNTCSFWGDIEKSVFDIQVKHINNALEMLLTTFLFVIIEFLYWILALVNINWSNPLNLENALSFYCDAFLKK